MPSPKNGGGKICFFALDEEKDTVLLDIFPDDFIRPVVNRGRRRAVRSFVRASQP